MIKFEFNNERQILEVFYIGDICLSQILEYGEMIRMNTTFPRKLKILTDATSANYMLSRSDINEMMNSLKEQIKPYQLVKAAFLHDKPVETAMSMIVDDNSNIGGYDHKVFSTREAALEWLFS